MGTGAGRPPCSAKDILDLEHWLAAAFFGQQAAEKAVKALFIVKEREESPKTHNLVAIAERLKAPERIVEALRRVTPVYTVSRYPDAANAQPARAFNREIAARVIADATEVLRWVEGSLLQS